MATGSFSGRIGLGLAIAALALCVNTTHAQFTWNGGGTNDNLTTDANWLGGTAPVAGSAGDLIFTGSTRLTPNVDTPFLGIDSILFDASADAFTIGGFDLTFNDGATITTSNANIQTLNTNLIAMGSTIVFDSDSGLLALGFGTDLDLSDTGGVIAVFNGASDTTVFGTISGAGGSITKNDAGTLTLLGANTYTGPTQVNSGTLTIGSTGSITSDVTIANDPSAEFRIAAGGLATGGVNNSNAFVIETTGTLTGNLTNNATGTTTLTGNLNGNVSNAGLYNIFGQHTGNITSNTGTTNIQNLGGLVGDVTSNTGTLTIQNGGNMTGDVTSNTGTITIESGGVLTGNVATSGDFNLNSGAMMTGNLTHTGFTADDQAIIAGTVTGTITANFRQISITGTGLVTSDASVGTNSSSVIELSEVGATIGGNVSNSNAFRGLGTVQGNLTSVANVDSQVVAGLLDQTAGQTLTVGGDLTLGAGASLVVELDPTNNGVADSVAVGGATNLNNGSVLFITSSSPGTAFTPGNSYTVLTSTNPIVNSGFGASNLTGEGGLIITVDVLTNTIVINLEDFLDFTVAASSMGANEQAVAAQVDAIRADLIASASDITDITTWSGATSTQQMLQELGPGSYFAGTTTNLQNSQQFAGNVSGYLAARRSGAPAVVNHITVDSMGPMIASAAVDPSILAYALDENNRSSEGRRTALRPVRPSENTNNGFVRVFGVFDEQDATSIRAGYDSDAFGIFAGFDHETSLWRRDVVVGLSLGYVNTSVDLTGGRGSSDIDTFRIGPYASYEAGPWFLDASITAGLHTSDNTRNLPSAMMSTTSDGDAYDISIYGDIGYNYRLGREYYFTPMLSMLYVYYNEDALTESGGGLAALSVAERTVTSLRTRLGAKVSRTYRTPRRTVVLEGFAGWENESLSGDADEIEARFVAGGGPFTINTGSPDENAAYLGGGATLLVDDDTSVYLLYDGTYYGDGTTHAIGGGVTFKF